MFKIFLGTFENVGPEKDDAF